MKQQKIRGPVHSRRSRSIIRRSPHYGVWTQQYRDRVRHDLQNPMMTEDLRRELVEKIRDYARLGGNVKGLLT